MANAGSTWASATQWNARSHAANQGYSHLSGIDMMSKASKPRQRALRPCEPGVRRPRLGRIAVQPARDVVVVELLAPQHPGEGLPHHQRLVGRGGRRASARRRTRRPRPRRRATTSSKSDPSAVAGSPREPAGRSRSRSSTVAPAGTVSRYQNAHLVPRRSGLTVGAPDTTWSLMPSFGYGVAARTPYRRSTFVSFSQNSSVRPGAVRARGRPAAPAHRGTGGAPRPSRPRSASSPGRGLSTSQDHVLRNQAVGSTCRVSVSGPALVTCDRHQHVQRVGLGVVHVDDPVAVVVEGSGVEQLVLGIELAPPAVLVRAAPRTGTPPADSGSATGSRRGSARRRGTTSTP